MEIKPLDISLQTPSHPAPIHQVGLDKVELPLKMELQGAVTGLIPAQIQAVVSLDDPNLRGIHMSRIYLALCEFSRTKEVSQNSLEELLQKIISDQKGAAGSGRIRVSWKNFLEKKSLKSSHTGFHAYPCFYEVSLKDHKKQFIMGSEVLYSSTCPCSASLSRELIQEKFKQSGLSSKEEIFEWLGRENSIAGVPHAQRSKACFQVQPISSSLSLSELIGNVEDVLKTAVQAAVKKEDEKAFALRNAQNLMFTEDAFRKISHYFKNHPGIQKYKVQVRHLESLHPFDTIALSNSEGE